MATPLQTENTNLIAGRFQLLRKLGEGGYGAVYEAIDRESRTRVALKTLQRMEADALMRFKEEFRSLQDVEHANLVHLSELMCSDGLWFFTMELVEGTDFLEHVRSTRDTVSRKQTTGPLDVHRLRRLLVQLVNALVAIHGSGRVHCDIKPSNIRVEPSGRLVVLDFGLITPSSGPPSEDLGDGVLGTPAYMSPEQCRGDSVTPASDWYAMGIVLFEVLAGILPFNGHVARVLLDKQQRGSPDPRLIDPHVPDDLAQLCMSLTSIRAEDRPDASAILSVLLADNDAMSSDVVPVPRRAPSSTQEGPAFIGRGVELDKLRKHFTRTRVGKPALAYVSGESGVGKSALASYFAEEVFEREDTLIFRSRCYERETVPYKAFDGIVDDLARHLARIDARRCRALLPIETRLLIPIFPVLSSVKSLVGLPESRSPRDPNVLRAQAFGALREVLARLALERPLLLLIDDLQWTDVDSLSLMEELFAGPEAPACMVLCTGRPLPQLGSDVAHGLKPLLSASYAEEIPLSGLTPGEAEQLVRTLSDERDVGMVQRIAEEAKGHPLFVAELVRHLEAGHQLGKGQRLDDAIRERVATLSEPTRELLELVAVASTPINHKVLAHVLELDVTDLGRRLAQLRAANLARSEHKRTVECYHDRVRSSVLEGLEPAQKRRRHRELAAALSQLRAADPEQIADQWRAAGDGVRAARYYAEAADAADRALAFNRAARLYDEALSSGEAFDPKHLVKLKIAHAGALSCAGLSGRAAEVYLEASKAHEGSEARMLRRRATQLMLRSGRLTEGLKLADDVLGEVGLKRPTTPTRAVFRLAWERARLAALDLDRSPPLHQAGTDDPRSETLDLLWAVAPSLAYVDFLGGSALQSAYARMALASGDVSHVMRSLTNEALLYSTMERSPQPKVTGLLERVRNAADLTNEPYHRALSFMSHGYVHWTNFRLTDAISSLVRAERILRESCVDVAWELTIARSGLLNALWNHGDAFQHDEHVSEWQRDARDRGDRNAGTQLVAIGLGYQAELRRDDPEAAETLLLESLNGWPDTFQLPQWSQYIGRQLVSLYERESGAYAMLRETWPRVKSSQLLRVPYFALLTHSDAAWACLSECVVADQSLRKSLVNETCAHAKAVSKTRWPLSSALADQIMAQVLVVQGKHEEALEMLQRADKELRAQHSVYQYPSIYLAGILMGGDGGRALRARALEWAKREEIARPVRWFSMFSPVIRMFP